MADNTAAPSVVSSAGAGDSNKPKSKKPSDSAFKQQRLPAWQPVMTARTVIPAFVVIGVIFVPIGAVMYDAANKIEEYVLDYTESCGDCYNNLSTTIDAPSCQCNTVIELKRDFKAPVYMYYGLDNFYQNHRRYVKSRDDSQLLGEDLSKDDINKDCDPFRVNSDGKIYAPCGAIANSLFNDSFTLMHNGSDVPLLRTGIAWPTDKKDKFKNPSYDTNLCDAKAFENTVPPPNWRKHVCELDNHTANNNGYENEDLIVWMRTAALPNFRKLYRRIDHSGIYKSELPAGKYTVHIQYNYPVKDFGGRKKMILSTTSWIGGKNVFLGIAYMTVGVICIVLAAVFLIVHLKIGNKVERMGDITDATPYVQ